MNTHVHADARGTPRQGEFEVHRDDRDRTLDAMHRLEEALAAAAPGREHSWRDGVLEALRELDEVTTTEADNAARVDSLVADIGRLHPRLRSRVHGLRAQYGHVREDITRLRRDLERAAAEEVLPDFDDIRHRLGWLLTALRHQRARESDLIYEAYYQTYRSELDGAPN